MSALPLISRSFPPLRALAALFLLGLAARAGAEDSAPGMNGVEAVASKVSDDYVRAVGPVGEARTIDIIDPAKK